MAEDKQPPTVHLPMDEWDSLVAKHLHSIEAGAELVETHTKQLFGIPNWELRAITTVDHAEQLLGAALTRLVKSRQDLQRKNRVS